MVLISVNKYITVCNTDNQVQYNCIRNLLKMLCNKWKKTLKVTGNSALLVLYHTKFQLLLKYGGKKNKKKWHEPDQGPFVNTLSSVKSTCHHEPLHQIWNALSQKHRMFQDLKEVIWS